MPYALAPLALATDTRLTLTDTRLLLGLLSFTKPDTMTCWPSRRTLAERLGVSSVSRISATIKRLESLGWLQVTRRYGSSMYRVIVPDTPPLHPVVEAPPPPRSGRPEQTSEQTKDPLTPARGGTARRATGAERRQQSDGSRATDVDVLALDQRFSEQGITSAEAVPASPCATHSDARSKPRPAVQRSGQRLRGSQEAVQTLIKRLSEIVGRPLPQGRATEQMVRRRVGRYGEQAIISVAAHKASQWRGTTFERHLSAPHVWLSPTRLESALAELEHKQEARLQRERLAERREQDQQRRERLAERRQQGSGSQSDGTREAARAGVAMLRAALGLRPADGEVTARRATA